MIWAMSNSNWNTWTLPSSGRGPAFARGSAPGARVLVLLCAICALGLSTASVARSATTADLIRTARSLPGASGAYAFDITAGRPLLNRRGGAKRILASNAKLFTAAATLDRFGPDERFITSLWTDGTVENGVLNGDVYLRGGGDPLFGSTDYVRKYFGSGATVEALALSASVGGLTGVNSITGSVYGDESMFDEHRGTAPYGFGRSGEIGGQLGGLIFNKGFDSGKFQRDPPRFAAQRMRAALKQTGVPADGGTGTRATPADARLIGYVESLPVSRIVKLMDKPSNNYLAEMLVKSLAMPIEAVAGGGAGGSPTSRSADGGSAGVITTGGSDGGGSSGRSVTVDGSAGGGTTGRVTGGLAGGSSTTGGPVRGNPTGTMAADSGGAPPTPSDPVLTAAPPATTSAGADSSRAFAARLSARVTLGDGSGLSRADRAAPREVVDLLRGMSTHVAFTPFDDSLPIPGVDGTLAGRMRGTEASKRCRAKTGTLSNVSALSGYCTTKSNHLVAFSILNNRVWPPTARVAQDRIVKTIAKLD